MANIIIMDKNQPSQKQHFRPHYNRAIGKYISSKTEYLQCLKEMDLVPYEKPKSKKEFKYKTSEWAKGMINTKNKGSVFYKELEKKGYSEEQIKKLKREAEKARAKGY